MIAPSILPELTLKVKVLVIVLVIHFGTRPHNDHYYCLLANSVERDSNPSLHERYVVRIHTLQNVHRFQPYYLAFRGTEISTRQFTLLSNYPATYLLGTSGVTLT